MENYNNCLEYMHYGQKILRTVNNEWGEKELVNRKDEITLLPITGLDASVEVYKTEDHNNGNDTFMLVYPDELGNTIVYEFYKMPDDLDIEKLIFDVENQVKGKQPMTMPTKCKAILKKASEYAYNKMHLRRLKDKEMKVYERILLEEREEYKKSLPVEKVEVYEKLLIGKIESTEAMDMLLSDHSSTNAEDRMDNLLKAKYLHKLGYNFDYFCKNDTKDIYENELNGLMIAFNDTKNLYAML